MGHRDAASVLLPTIHWREACDQLAEQLRPGDELLVLCDSEDDPVTSHVPPEGVEILVAGEPDGCSGKANAIAYGMERAENDRFVWTDADFDRDDDWLDRLVAEGERHGPATTIPFFYGGGFWSVIEPWSALFSTAFMYFDVGTWGGNAWGGGVTFTREELDVSVAELADELRRALSDDGLLSQQLPDVYAIRSMVTPVEVPGDLSTTYHRLVRFSRITHVHEGSVVAFVVTLVAAVLGALYPLVVAPAVTLLFGAMYLLVGVSRPTFLLSYLGLFLAPLVNLSGIVVSEFDWAGRSYRLADAHEVEVLGEVR
jgi:hypothetical protein